jgi:hypothetical protein
VRARLIRLIGAALLLSAAPPAAAAEGECRFGARPPVTLKNMGPCNFDLGTMSFAGSYAEQAACLTTTVLKFGQLGARNQLPENFARRVGRSVDLPNKEAVAALLKEFGLADFVTRLNEAVANAGDNDPLAPSVTYFVMHDTSGPNFHGRDFPPDIDGDARINSLDRFRCSNHIEPAHVFINRSGVVFFPHDFDVPWRATKFERATNFASALKGLFVHVELVQPRRAEPGRGWRNDFQAPAPGFSEAQYERLALVYIVASTRAGRWLIPAFHAVIDEWIYDKHDDPQNFEFARFNDKLEALLARLNGTARQGVSVH